MASSNSDAVATTFGGASGCAAGAQCANLGVPEVSAGKYVLIELGHDSTPRLVETLTIHSDGRFSFSLGTPDCHSLLEDRAAFVTPTEARFRNGDCVLEFTLGEESATVRERGCTFVFLGAACPSASRKLPRELRQ
jgi:hypothetical protein